MRFEVYEDTGGHYRWRLWSGSNRVASSGESFYSRSNADRAATTFRSNARTYRYEAFGSGSRWYWHATASNGENVASGGESFVSRASAERSMNNVRDNAGSATGP